MLGKRSVFVWLWLVMVFHSLVLAVVQDIMM